MITKNALIFYKQAYTGYS